MNTKNMEIVAKSIEANAEYYDQGDCPIYVTPVSCGCVAHFVEWELGENDGGIVSGMAVRFDVSWDDAEKIYGWPSDLTAKKAAERLRWMIRNDSPVYRGER